MITIECTGEMPKRATPGSAGFDLVNMSQADVHLGPLECQAFPTGMSISIPEFMCGLVLPRSGLAKAGVVVANSPGLIDPDYRGEVKVLLRNLSDDPVLIKPGDRIAQLVLVTLPPVMFQSVDQLPATERGDGGFGSTGR